PSAESPREAPAGREVELAERRAAQPPSPGEADRDRHGEPGPHEGGGPGRQHAAENVHEPSAAGQHEEREGGAGEPGHRSAPASYRRSHASTGPGTGTNSG